MLLEEGALFAERYQLVKLLGRGGFSEVWMANDTKSGVDVALKVYAPYGGLDDYGNRLFSQEFSLMFNINQTNLLKPTYFDTFERSPYLILPYCRRGSTFSLIGKTDEKTMIDILHDVAAGLSYLHAQEPPIIHQDIKPDNILINDHGEYVITDFGISTKIRSTLRQSAKSREATSGGTCVYMAPERFSKTPTPIRASDIWSMGAMAYELLDGNPPFDPMGGVMQKNGAEIPEIRADVSDALKSIIYACVAKEPWDRPTADTVVEWTNKLRAGESLNLGGTVNPVPIEPTPTPAPAPAPAPAPDPTPTIVPTASPASATIAFKKEPLEPAPQPQIRSFKTNSDSDNAPNTASASVFNSFLASFKEKPWLKYALLGVLAILTIWGLASLLSRSKKPVQDLLFINGQEICRVDLESAATERTFKIEKNFEERWLYSGVPKWCTPTAKVGALTLRVSENLTNEDRTATIIFQKKGGNAVVGNLIINQKGKVTPNPSEADNKANNQTQTQPQNQSQIPDNTESKVGSIRISSTPYRAAIFIDGKNTHKTTPDIINDIPEGRHTVKLVLYGCENYSETVNVSSDKQVVLNISLIHEQAKGNAVMSSAKREMKISKKELSLKVGESETLLAHNYGKSVAWSSDNSSVATVSSSGVVKAVRSGNATIWAEGENGDLQYCKVIVEEAKTIETIPYEQVDVKPTFQNGDLNQFAHWVSENITYPTDALKRKVQGLVKIRFIVDTDGSVAGVKVLVSADSALDAEAKKVISQSPKWKPGSMDGKPARVICTFPVEFKLN